MFVISPVNDKVLQEKYALICGAKYRSDYFAYAMTDNETGDFMGFSQFEINENGGLISDLREKPGLSDGEAMFILGRATMNFIDLCGAHVCYAEKNSGDSALLHSIGFKTEKNDLLFCDMTGMFDGKCSGH
jgi:hypothetical protein